ncbi:hypothetical protein HMI01_24700 [Halolactibacillus miurensis]|uniref:Uncharacterized protein n=1 Tax=Halolactibacillus miurensis TaxID=306541 RepID=A0ABQ0VWE8_9BACI|nr:MULTISPECIES: hypothetical protein [Halolactibacillus]GEM05482.1 hypothetical protein HMI01_24700 [Halolactibacillus miurensis]
MFLTVSTTSVFAQTGSSSLKDNKVDFGQELVIDESTEGISDVLTYEELVSKVANDQNISKEQGRIMLNGDFYNNGTTTYNGSLNIGIGKYGSVSFGVSHATNWYKYKYQEGHKYF